MKFFYGGKFRLQPKLSYLGGKFVDVDWIKASEFDLSNVDVMALRCGYEEGEQMLYAHTEQKSELLVGIAPLLCEADVVKLRKFAPFERFVELYIESKPSFDVWAKFAERKPLRTLSCPPSVDRILDPSEAYDGPILSLTDRVHQTDDDESDDDYCYEDGNVGTTQKTVEEVRFWRDGDDYDTELDDEVTAAKQAVGQDRMILMNLIAKENEDMIKRKMEEKGITEEDFVNRYVNRRKGKQIKKEKPKSKFQSTYARHGHKFSVRREGGYVEVSSDSEHSQMSEEDSAESKSDVKESDSDDSEEESAEGVTQQESEEVNKKFDELNAEIRKSLRYVHFNEQDMCKGILFPGLVFSSKEQLREAPTDGFMYS